MCLIRHGATTHAFDENQLYVPLDFTPAGNPPRLLATTPASPDSAPPGYYMLFLVGSPEGIEVPSVAKWLRLGPEGRDTCDTVKPEMMSPFIETVTTSSMKLTFTHCADDGLLAPSGRGKSYDLRRKLTAINSETTWNSATQLTGEPTPGAVNDTASYIASGLSSCTWYHFALRALDDNTNLSLLHGAVAAKTLGTGCSGGGSLRTPDGTDLMRGSSPIVAAAGTTMDRPRPQVGTTAVGPSSTSGRLVIRTYETTSPGWRVVVNREDEPEGIGPADEAAIVLQDGHAATWSTRGLMIPEPTEDRVGLCALRDRGRIVLPAGYVLLQVASVLHTGTSDLSLVEAWHSGLGLVLDQLATIETIPLLLGDSLTMSYESSATTPAEAESWFMVVGPGGASRVMHRQPSEEFDSVPRRYALHPSRPNPFQGITTLAFDLPVAQHVLLQVIDLQGRMVKTLLDGQQPQGSHAIDWDGCDDDGRKVAAGTYVCRLRTESFRAQRKLTTLP